MGRTSSANPFGFTALGTGIWISIVYLAVIIPLLWTHEIVPSAPPPEEIKQEYGLNLTEAWLDLSYISGGYHPYNTRRNDDVRAYLLKRVSAIVGENKNLSVAYAPITHTPKTHQTSLAHKYNFQNHSRHDVVVFDDLQSSLSFSSLGGIGASGRLPGISVYFEGSNLMVYIRGKEDIEGDWWNSDRISPKQRHSRGGVLVNAHYDSVSTGYGATDDGVGVVTVLQLIKYFTLPGNQPKKGIVALLNNGEEDFLNGVRAYTQHPLSKFAYTFLNLEGAGAGGRAMLFRSTDAQVTEAYAESPYPFGTVITGDAFKLGAIRSQTDYVVLEETLGLRGLDVAFWTPRARYHTDQDDARHTSIDRLYHMLSTSIETVHSLASDTSDTFDGPRGDRADSKVKNGIPSDGVWLDIFGKIFLTFHLRSLFAWSLTLAIAGPLILLLVSYILIGTGKFYYFSSHPPVQGTGERLSLHGWRGFFRFPFAFVISSALTIGSAFLVAKMNPLIVYSSLYTVWTMMFTLFFCSFWFIMKGADFTRPSALHRGYALLWLFLIGWVVLVASTVYEDRFNVASGYIFVFYEGVIFLATLIGLLESSALPSKDSYARYMTHEQQDRDALDELPEESTMAATPTEEEEDPTERTSLLGEASTTNVAKRSGFANYTNPASGDHRAHTHARDDHFKQVCYGKRVIMYSTNIFQYEPYGSEQAWSAKMPQWTWLLQFLLLGPVMLIVIGQVALVLVTAVSQTGADGSSLLLPYTLMAAFTILLLLPIGPFAHRISYHIPTFLFLIFIGTIAYSLLAFPFSAQNRYKAYFQQRINLETGENEVTLAGLEEYIRPIIATLPSASGQLINCESRPTKTGLHFCTYKGISPQVVKPTAISASKKQKEYKDWLSYNITTNPSNPLTATFSISGKDTRACVLRFNKSIHDFNVHSKYNSDDPRFPKVSESGSSEIRLWHRKWNDVWKVDVEWPEDTTEEERTGSVACLWSDDNVEGVIPALDEIRRYAPAWSAVTKLGDGLVEGYKEFAV